MMTELQPRYIHDKTCCILVGYYKNGDLYQCAQFSGAYALRYGNRPEDYYGGGTLPVLVELYETNIGFYEKEKK